MSVRERILDAILDPDGSTSSTRICAISFAVAAIAVVVTGLVQHHEYAATVTALISGGTVSLLSRTKTNA